MIRAIVSDVGSTICKHAGGESCGGPYQIYIKDNALLYDATWLYKIETFWSFKPSLCNKV